MKRDHHFEFVLHVQRSVNDLMKLINKYRKSKQCNKERKKQTNKQTRK